MKHYITLLEVQERNTNTFTIKDNSPRGCHTISKKDIKTGDIILIDNYFCEVIEKAVNQK